MGYTVLTMLGLYMVGGFLIPLEQAVIFAKNEQPDQDIESDSRAIAVISNLARKNHILSHVIEYPHSSGTCCVLLVTQTKYAKERSELIEGFAFEDAEEKYKEYMISKGVDYSKVEYKSLIDKLDCFIP